MVSEDDDDGMMNSKLDDGVKDNKDDKCGMEERLLKKYQIRKVSLRLTLEPYLLHKGS